MDVEYTRRGQGNLNTVLGAIGTAGAVGILNGGLGGLFGGARNLNVNGECSENHLVNRYEASQQAKIAQLETKIKLRDSNIYTDQKSGSRSLRSQLPYVRPTTFSFAAISSWDSPFSILSFLRFSANTGNHPSYIVSQSV